MPIFVNGRPYPLNQVKTELSLNFGIDLLNTQPESLVDQLLARCDFQNRRFKNWEELAAEIEAATGNEATDVGGLMDINWAAANFPAQFKAIFKAKLGRREYLKFIEKGGGNLLNEVEALRKIEKLGLRVVPVCGNVRQENGRSTMYQRCIQGNFVDLFKETPGTNCLGEKLALTLQATFKGIAMPCGEAPFALQAVREKVAKAATEGWHSSAAAILTALMDFGKIATLLCNSAYCISDLQGILEFATGKFFIADPLALLLQRDVTRQDEEIQMKNAKLNVCHVVGFLGRLLGEASVELNKKQPLIRLQTPPPGGRTRKKK